MSFGRKCAVETKLPTQEVHKRQSGDFARVLTRLFDNPSDRSDYGKSTLHPGIRWSTTLVVDTVGADNAWGP